MRLDPNGFAAALAAERGFVVFEDFAAIPLCRHRGWRNEYVMVSIEDRHLGRFNWSPSRWGYPRRRLSNSEAVFMHREIMGCTRGDGLIVDHINRDKMDARRSNLRFLTQAQNSQNQGPRRGGTSIHRGVSFNRVQRKWIVMHKLRGENVYGGVFDTEEEAAEVARAWRAEHMPYAGDSSQYRGVSWDAVRGKWKAVVKVNYRDVFLGRFDSEEEAAAVARAFRLEHMPGAVD